MTTRVLDERGRLFGRINLVDAAIGAFVIVLIPIAYGTLLLFRPATPTITSVDHAQVTNVEERAGGGTIVQGKLKVHGTGFRPTLRAMIGNQEVIGFVFETPTTADVIFGDVAPGTHDLVLYDGVQEVARSRGAVTIGARAVVQRARVLLVGALVGLDARSASALKAGDRYPAGGDAESEIVALGDVAPDYRRVSFDRGYSDVVVPDTVQRPAAIRTSCDAVGSEECRIGGASVGLSDRLLVVPGAPGNIRMAIAEVLPASPPRGATAHVRFVAHADALDRAKPGDRDVPNLAVDGRGAVIESLSRRGDVAAQVTIGSADTGAGGSRAREVVQASIPDRLAVADAVVRLGLDPMPSGWRYRGQPVKAGGTLTFTTEGYLMRGSILSVALDSERANENGRR